MRKNLIVLIGHKARQGKDLLAELLTNYIKISYSDINVYTVHWADALKDEVRYSSENPLILMHNSEYVLLREGDKGDYVGIKKSDVPELVEIMKDRDANLYYGIKDGEKDREILQWWGTDYRRKHDKNYWVNLGVEKINNILKKSKSPTVIFVPDTRFKNELMNTKAPATIIYIEVQRMKDGKQYIIDENSNHPSETELDFIVNHIDDDDYMHLIKTDFNDEAKLLQQGIKIIKKYLNEMIEED